MGRHHISILVSVHNFLIGIVVLMHEVAGILILIREQLIGYERINGIAEI